MDISIKLASFIFLPNLNQMLQDLKRLQLPQKLQARPTKLWKPATNSGIAVIGILNAMNAPIVPLQ